MAASRYITWTIIAVGTCAIGGALSMAFHFKYGLLSPIVGLIIVVGIWAYAMSGAGRENKE